MENIYNTTNTLYSIGISFLLAFIFIKIGIPALHRLKFGQNVRKDGIQSHLAKTGTPSMGGVLFLSSFIITIIISFILFEFNMEIFMLALLTVGYGIIGMIDDLTKIKMKRSMGLNSIQKLILQFIVTTIFLIMVMINIPDYSSLYIPFVDGYKLDLGIYYIPFFYIFMLGTVNAVNLTDGLDGLATGVTLLIVTFFGFTALALDSIMYFPSFVLVASLIAFLYFNYNPAKVFMGDTGSLGLGGFVAGIAIILKMPIYIALVGIIYFINALSVMIQVTYFKYTKRKYGEGKRVFKMAPFHHHLEASGWSEIKVVLVFYLITAIACLIGYIAM